MDRTAEQYVGTSGVGADANATGVKLIVPLFENCVITEFGLYNDSGADVGTGLVLKLQGVDTTANGGTYTDLLVCTTTASSIRGTITARRCEVGVEKDAVTPNTTVLSNRAIANGTVVLPSTSKQFVAIQLNVTTGGASSSKAVFYLKYRKAGSGSTAISGGEVLVTA
jgi:hypothetical protein